MMVMASKMTDVRRKNHSNRNANMPSMAELLKEEEKREEKKKEEEEEEKERERERIV